MCICQNTDTTSLLLIFQIHSGVFSLHSWKICYGLLMGFGPTLSSGIVHSQVCFSWANTVSTLWSHEGCLANLGHLSRDSIILYWKRSYSFPIIARGLIEHLHVIFHRCTWSDFWCWHTGWDLVCYMMLMQNALQTSLLVNSLCKYVQYNYPLHVICGR